MNPQLTIDVYRPSDKEAVVESTRVVRLRPAWPKELVVEIALTLFLVVSGFL